VSAVRVGLVLPMASEDPGRVPAFARRAEELGFDGVFAFDHLFPPGAPPDRPSLEAFATLAVVAAVTERIALGTLVARASLRPAGLLAKQAAMLDDASGGRFVLGIGTGDAVGRAEHEVFGLPYLDPRVRRGHLEETVRAVRSLFVGEAFAGGAHVPALAGPLLPPPRTRGGPRVWVGGMSAAAVRIAAREADGWNGWGLPVDRFAARAELLATESDERTLDATWGGAVVVGEDAAEAERLAERRRARGLQPDAFSGDVDAAASRIADLAAAGAAWVILLAAGGPDRAELIGERVLPLVRDLP
jgi:alkanesulfonate monooxygenase SsuD/methylene tetrahydromethanopterin reductase-like flavin-dependent oxidoreductase (luciferase family)